MTASVDRSFRVGSEPWVAFRPALDAMLEPLGDAVLSRVLPRAGESALDVGCGCGTTTHELARTVGPTGSVTGIDTSEAVLAVARRGAPDADAAARATFVRGDAGTHPFPGHAYDVIVSRLGTMFFDEPGAAFANLRRALRLGGRLGFVTWGPLVDNPWTTIPRDAADAIVPLPPLPPPGAPGPFSQSDPDALADLLGHAGFVDVAIARHDQPLLIGRGDVDEAVEFYLRLLPTGYLMFEPDRHLLDRLKVALHRALEPHRGPGDLLLGASAWIVTAR
jgi:SAM-dependent methyltransferase